MLLKGSRISHDNVFSGSRVVTWAHTERCDKTTSSVSAPFHCDCARRLLAVRQTAKIHSYFSKVFPVILHKLLHWCSS